MLSVCVLGGDVVQLQVDDAVTVYFIWNSVSCPKILLFGSYANKVMLLMVLLPTNDRENLQLVTDEPVAMIRENRQLVTNAPVQFE